MDVRKEGLPQNPHFSVQGLSTANSSVSAAPLSSKQLPLGRLSPYFVTCTAYFLLWIPEEPPSWVGALVKCLPVLCLAGLLQASPGGRYGCLLQVALLFSALGDIFLIWPEAFIYGVLAFTQSQLLYIWAFGFRPLQPGLLLPILLTCLPLYGLLMLHLPPNMVLPLSTYSLALTTMLWRGLARGGSARWGALFFTISDTTLAWDAFIQPLAHARLLIMATYYAAQLLIALSAFQNPRLKTN